MKYKRLIKKWASLRNPDPQFAKVAINFYENANEKDRKAMLEEWQNYIEGVRDKKIIPGPITIPIRVFKDKKTM